MRLARIALLLVLIPTVTTLSVVSFPRKVMAAGCCGWEYRWLYYSDAGKTNQVGERYSNDCTGASSSTGATTAYINFTKTCCNPC